MSALNPTATLFEITEASSIRPESVVNGRDGAVIPSLLSVHTRPNPRILDVTHNTGKMWKGLGYSVTALDIDPQYGVLAGDFCALPVAAGTFDVIAFDPPHLPNANATNNRTTGHADVYGVRVQAAARAADHVGGFFASFLSEARRVLRPEGIVIAKIADLVHNHRYQWQHVDFITAVRQVGLTPCDLIIKADPCAGNLASSKWQNVHHFRRAHCYWIVVRKGRCEPRHQVTEQATRA